ncbi:hypothetical protein I3842_04G136400 [Carya illinoinensis]|uniref:Uncharacterized protein n=1 Tax=Carya illinoinensis TaxID=32201 RepID=A0A922FC98_CARIL|nr:hypothetical protein I3842_04G136400 [Carya illinoinensis]
MFHTLTSQFIALMPKQPFLFTLVFGELQQPPRSLPSCSHCRCTTANLLATPSSTSLKGLCFCISKQRKPVMTRCHQPRHSEPNTATSHLSFTHVPLYGLLSHQPR